MLPLYAVPVSALIGRPQYPHFNLLRSRYATAVKSGISTAIADETRMSAPTKSSIAVIMQKGMSGFIVAVIFENIAIPTIGIATDNRSVKYSDGTTLPTSSVTDEYTDAAII